MGPEPRVLDSKQHLSHCKDCPIHPNLSVSSVFKGLHYILAYCHMLLRRYAATLHCTAAKLLSLLSLLSLPLLAASC